MLIEKAAAPAARPKPSKIFVAIRKYKARYRLAAAWAIAWRIRLGVRPMCHQSQNGHLYGHIVGLFVRRLARYATALAAFSS